MRSVRGGLSTPPLPLFARLHLRARCSPRRSTLALPASTDPLQLIWNQAPDPVTSTPAAPGTWPPSPKLQAPCLVSQGEGAPVEAGAAVAGSKPALPTNWWGRSANWAAGGCWSLQESSSFSKFKHPSLFRSVLKFSRFLPPAPPVRARLGPAASPPVVGLLNYSGGLEQLLSGLRHGGEGKRLREPPTGCQVC